MVYVVAKNKNKRGCYALKTTAGKHITALKRYLYFDMKLTGLQVVTISRPTAYGEYAPYKFVKDETEFIEKAVSLMS